MEKGCGKEYETNEERIVFLEDNVDSVENKEYFRRSTPQELKEKKNRKTDVNVEVVDLDEKRKAKMKEYRDKIDSLAREEKQPLRCIKKKGQVVSGRLFKPVNNEGRMVDFYNGQSDLVESYLALLGELRTTILQMNRMGTSDQKSYNCDKAGTHQHDCRTC